MSEDRWYYRFSQPFLKEEVCGYREYMTCDPVIALFYEFSLENKKPGEPGYRNLTYIPNGGVDILFVRKGEHQLMEFVGICTQQKSITGFLGASYFGIRLYPGAKISYRGVCLNTLTNEEYIFTGRDALLAPFFAELSHMSSLEEKSRLFLSSFLTCWDLKETDHLTRTVLTEIRNTRGSIRIEELAEKTHYSMRHISRMFHEAVGVSPKAFSKIVRFQYVVNEILEKPQESISEYLDEYGYSDQAHFQREFKQYVGITPGHFVRQIHTGG